MCKVTKGWLITPFLLPTLAVTLSTKLTGNTEASAWICNGCMRKKMKIEMHMINKYEKQSMKHEHKNNNFTKKIRKKILYIFHIESLQDDMVSFKL